MKQTLSSRAHVLVGPAGVFGLARHRISSPPLPASTRRCSAAPSGARPASSSASSPYPVLSAPHFERRDAEESSKLLTVERKSRTIHARVVFPGRSARRRDSTPFSSSNPACNSAARYGASAGASRPRCPVPRRGPTQCARSRARRSRRPCSSSEGSPRAAATGMRAVSSTSHALRLRRGRELSQRASPARTFPRRAARVLVARFLVRVQLPEERPAGAPRRRSLSPRSAPRAGAQPRAGRGRPSRCRSPGLTCGRAGRPGRTGAAAGTARTSGCRALRAARP